MANTSNGQAGAATELSKKELVRQAIGHLGRDAKPLQLQAHIKTKFGVEMSPNHISASKTEVLRETPGGAKSATVTAAKPVATKPAMQKPQAAKSAAKTKPAPKVVGAAPAGGPVTGNGNGSAGISLHDIQAAKELVGRVGAVQLRTLIDLVAN